MESLPSIYDMKTNGSLYIGSIAPRYEQENKDFYIIEDVKNNPKYYGRKGPRLTNKDLIILSHFCQEYGIVVGYDKKINTLWFENENKNPITFKISGNMTGGQLIRLIMTNVINSMDRKTPTQSSLKLNPYSLWDKTNGTVDKASMLFVQGKMWTLNIGDTFIVEGGDPFNPDAKSWDSHESMFDLFRSIFGYNFILNNISEDENNYKFLLTRGEDITSDRLEMCTINTDVHTADQILMGVIAIKEKPIFHEIPMITIICDYTTDYHITGMINTAKTLGLNIFDSNDGTKRTISIN
jgi:hypothetical protein